MGNIRLIPGKWETTGKNNGKNNQFQIIFNHTSTQHSMGKSHLKSSIHRNSSCHDMGKHRELLSHGDSTYSYDSHSPGALL